VFTTFKLGKDVSFLKAQVNHLLTPSVSEKDPLPVQHKPVSYQIGL